MLSLAAITITAVAHLALSFTMPGGPLRTPVSRRIAPAMTAQEKPFEIVLLRHGESTWNDEGLFTGWYDCPLSVAGEVEAREGGKLLKEEGYVFDLAFTSYLKRAISTLWLALTELDQQWIPIKASWRLNERHYGALQGLDKKATVAEHGEAQVKIWRRSYDVPPPPVDDSSVHFPGNDPRYAQIPKDELPKCESLKLTEDRVKVDWETVIKPEVIAGKRVLIAAHGNTLRALAKLLDDIPPDVVASLNIPTGVPLVYYLDRETLKPIKHADAIAPLSGRYLGNQDDVKRRIGAVVAQTGPPVPA